MTVLLLVMLGFAALAVLYGTMSRRPWGINLRPPTRCPRCQAPLPRMLRKPADARQAMWGGYTCTACGAEIDKWGALRT